MGRGARQTIFSASTVCGDGFACGDSTDGTITVVLLSCANAPVAGNTSKTENAKRRMPDVMYDALQTPSQRTPVRHIAKDKWL
jgi:hypothetical protein